VCSDSQEILEDDPERLNVLHGSMESTCWMHTIPGRSFPRKWRASEQDILNRDQALHAERNRESESRGSETAADQNGMKKPEERVGILAVSWVKHRRHPLPPPRTHQSQNKLNVPSLQQNAPSTITLSLPLPVLPPHNIRQVLLTLPVSQSVRSTMERAES